MYTLSLRDIRRLYYTEPQRACILDRPEEFRELHAKLKKCREYEEFVEILGQLIKADKWNVYKPLPKWLMDKCTIKTTDLTHEERIIGTPMVLKMEDLGEDIQEEIRKKSHELVERIEEKCKVLLIINEETLEVRY